MNGIEERDPVQELLSVIGYTPVVGITLPADVDPVGAIREHLGSLKGTRLVYEFAVAYIETAEPAREVSLRIGSTTEPSHRFATWCDGLAGAMSAPESYSPLWRVFASHVSQADFLVLRAWKPKRRGSIADLREAERSAFSVRAIERRAAPVCTGLAGKWRTGEHEPVEAALCATA